MTLKRNSITDSEGALAEPRLNSPVRVIFRGQADHIVRRRGPVYNSRECIATRKPHGSLCMRTWAGELRSAPLR